MKQKLEADKTVLIILIIVCLFLPISAYSITLYMEEIVFTDTTIVLGNFVTVKDAPIYLKKQIEDYPLLLDREKIHLIPSRYIRNLLSRFTHQSVIISGTKTALLPKSFLTLYEKDYSTALAHYLISAFCKKDNRVEVDIISSPLPIRKRSGQTYSFRMSTQQEYMGFPLGNINVFTQSGPDNNAEAEALSLFVHQHIPVVQAREIVEGNEELSWEKLGITEQELNPFQGEILLPFEEIKGYQAIKKLNKGDIIYRSSIKRSLKVRAGEKVTITLRKGTILLSMTGKAGESGGIGDSIKVRPSLSSTWISGEITGKQEVRVEM
ncbi:MAG: flagellar basal body P-ring formation protein FlgA [Spirochaetales bacterium]|nr:flagellar basal body P-ring formation protein FlgA [Spirochaetales bacterium]